MTIIMRAGSVVAAVAFLMFGAVFSWAADELAPPRFGTWGYDLTTLDPRVKPGTDFFLHAVGNWLKRTEIPADRVKVGVDQQLSDITENIVRKLIEDAAAGRSGDPDAAKVGAAYRRTWTKLDHRVDRAGEGLAVSDPARRDGYLVSAAADCGARPERAAAEPGSRMRATRTRNVLAGSFGFAGLIQDRSACQIRRRPARAPVSADGFPIAFRYLRTAQSTGCHSRQTCSASVLSKPPTM